MHTRIQEIPFEGLKMGMFKATDNLALSWLTQPAKWIAYRAPVLSDVSRPRYPYGLEPAQIAWLCNAITDTAGSSGCIVEVGVARGMTTTFLAEHMRLSGDRRPYFCVDTFGGFVESDVEHEVIVRKKERSAYGAFSYNDVDIFRSNMRKNGYSNVECFVSDASKFDWSSIPPIDVMLLDVDLYIPTLAVLRNSMSRWAGNYRVMVDDVRPGGSWDGAHQAYYEFAEEAKLATRTIGGKGGIFTSTLGSAT